MGQRLSSLHPGPESAGHGLREVNRQHARIFALVGEFNASVKAGHEPPRLLIVLEEIIARTQVHAQTEEDMLKDLAHPAYRQQCRAHRRIVDELDDFRCCMVAGRDIEASDYFHVLDPLIIHHIRDEPAIFVKRKLITPTEVGAR